MAFISSSPFLTSQTSGLLSTRPRISPLPRPSRALPFPPSMQFMHSARGADERKLFVGGLPWSFTDSMLFELFEPFGEVIDTRVVTDRETGQSRGFGFVLFEEVEAAAAAALAMNGKSVMKRTLRVNLTVPRVPEEGRSERRTVKPYGVKPADGVRGPRSYGWNYGEGVPGRAIMPFEPEDEEGAHRRSRF